MSDLVNLATAYTLMIGLIAAWSWMLGKRIFNLNNRLIAMESSLLGSEEE